MRILYVMHVDWDWAKQRPHFIAEYLAMGNEVVVWYPFMQKRTQLRKNLSSGLKKIPFLFIPYSDQSSWIYKINIRIYKIIIWMYIRWFKPDFIWFCSPEHLDMLPNRHGARLVYDCMDDLSEFSMHSFKKRTMIRLEERLIRESDMVFCSSKNLWVKLQQRYGSDFPIRLVHNAFDPAPHTLSEVEEAEKRHYSSGRRYKIGYIGTISNWLDKDALCLLTDTFECLEIHMIGPIETDIPNEIQHERIQWHGSVPHGELKYYAREFDALFMPFIVNELIKSVDPVKFYEYIFFDKPIISIKYPEIQRFETFVDFYTDQETLKAILQNYIENGFKKKYSPEERDSFIARNTWGHRLRDIEETLYQLNV